MRWHASDKVYENGYTRRVESFAILPIIIHGEWVWLENFFVTEQYYSGYGGEGWDIIKLEKKEVAC